MLKQVFLAGLCVFVSVSLSFAQWATPTNVGATVNSASDDRRPSISSDDNTLYFSSDRPFGYGGFDIWETTGGPGSWGAPTNIGPQINTIDTEFLPSISSDGNTLYFISDRLGGVGDLDIWETVRGVGGVWGAPTNLGAPVNSAVTE